MMNKRKRKVVNCSECPILLWEADSVHWFQHHVRDLDIQDAVCEHGALAYYLFYKLVELYAEKYNSTDHEEMISLSWTSLKRELAFEVSIEDLKHIIEWFKARGRIDGETEDLLRFRFKINGFDSIASNWHKRKSRGAFAGAGLTPASGGPSALEENRIEENKIEKKKKKYDLDEKFDDFIDDGKIKEIAVAAIEYLNEKVGTKYNPTTSTNMRFIAGRVREGATLEDFKKCIDNMVGKWKDDPAMSVYLRPMTLFQGGKFWGYVRMADGTKEKRRGSYSGGGYHGSGVAI